MPERPDPAARLGTRPERRQARTKAAIDDAFVQLVLEHGHDGVSVEDIADRADIARATFYAHYPNKEAVLTSLCTRLTEELMIRVSYRTGPWDRVRREAVQAAYQHAADMPDLYRACLRDPRSRQAFLSTLARYAEQNFRSRLKALKRKPRVPPRVMALAFAGAQVALLEAWLAGDVDMKPEDLANVSLDLSIAGTAWAHGMTLAELGYEIETSPPARRTGTKEPPR